MLSIFYKLFLNQILYLDGIQNYFYNNSILSPYLTIDRHFKKELYETQYYNTFITGRLLGICYII